jgi:phenylacetate-CoA ligase
LAGDLSAIVADSSHRPAAAPISAQGLAGRADQTTKVKGMFVHPGRWAMSFGVIRRFARRGWW